MKKVNQRTAVAWCEKNSFLMIIYQMVSSAERHNSITQQKGQLLNCFVLFFSRFYWEPCFLIKASLLFNYWILKPTVKSKNRVFQPDFFIFEVLLYFNLFSVIVTYLHYWLTLLNSLLHLFLFSVFYSCASDDLYKASQAKFFLKKKVKRFFALLLDFL